MARVVALLLAAALAAGCASRPVSPALFAVIPAPDGHVGTIVVHRDGERQVVHSAYGAQRLRGDGRLEPVRLSAHEVKAAFGPTLAALPGVPATFVLYFLEGRDDLTADSARELERVIAEIARRPLPDIVVIGHTDTVGSGGYNDALSLARAERMRDLLVARGIPARRIQVAGRGERELLVPTADDAREPRNRRVEINVR